MKKMESIETAFRTIKAVFVLMFLSVAFVAAAGPVTPYTSDANTVLLDHLDDATSASILAYSETGAACGSAKPSATPNSAYGSGPNGLSQALNLSPPTGEPAGSSTYLKYPGGQLLSQSNGTIEFWTYLTSYGTGVSLVQQGPFPGSCAGWTFSMGVNAAGQLSAGAWAAFNMNSGASTVPLDTWTHVAATWGSAGAKLYINGELAGSDTNTGMPASGYGGSVMVNYSTIADTQFDEIRISNIQRTSFNIAMESTGSIQLSSATYSVGEAGPTVTVTATRTDGSSGVIGISYSTSNGTATDESDYTSASGTLSWTNGDSADKTFTIPITNDTLDEPDEIFTVTLSSPTGGATLGSPANASVTITDNDTGAGSVSGNISYSGGRTGTIYVALSNSPVITPGVPSPQYYTELSSPGAYTISGVPDGTYYIGAIRTSNLNAIQSEDPYGMYGIDFVSDFTADSVTVSGGAAVTGKNFIMTDGTAENPNPFYAPPAHHTGFPIAATTGYEFAVNTAFDGTNYLVGIQGNVSASNNITAQLVSASGTLVGSRISVGGTGGAPKIAFDETNYLMVWEDDANSPDFDIHGQFISKAGTLVGSPFTINQAAGPQSMWFRNIVYDGTNYFVIWDSAPTPDGCADEYGQFVTPSGQLLGLPIKINQTVCGGGGITLAYDGTKILAVWISEWTSGGTRNGCAGDNCEAVNVIGQFITKSGAGTPGALSGSNFWIDESSVSKHIPFLSFDGTNYLVVFPEDTGLPDVCGDNGCNFNISAYLVTQAGALASSKITVNNAAGQQLFPQVAYDGTNYLIVWTDMSNDTNGDGVCNSGEGTCWDIYGQYISKTGTLAGPEFPVNIDSGNQFGAVNFGGGKYFVTYTAIDVMDGAIGDVYGMLMTPGFPIATTSLGETAMTAAFDGTNYLVGIETNTNELPGNIVAQMISSTGSTVGDLIDTGRTGIGSSIAFDGTNYLMIWEDDLGGHWNEFAYFTIYGQFISIAGEKVGSPFAISSSGIEFDGINILSYGGGKYLATYTKLINPANGENSDNRYIAGRFIQPNGTLGSEFRISTGYGAKNTMAFDGTNFFVIWVEDSQDKAVRGRFVSPAGVLGTEISINASAAPSDNTLAVTFDGINYLVAWNDEISAGEWNIFGQLVKPNGTLAGGLITIENSAGAQMLTSISYNATSYFVVWADMKNDANHDSICDAAEGTCWDVYGRYIGKDGIPAGNKFVVNNDADNQLGFVTNYNNGKYLVIVNNGIVFGENGIEGGDVYGMFITPSVSPKQLTVIKSGTGSGDVTQDIGTLTWSGNQGKGTYSSGDTVVLTAEPNERISITGWVGCGSVSVDKTKCTVLMSAARTVTATFTADPKYTLTTVKGGTGTGTITSAPAGVNCPGDCSELYWKNTVVTLTAEAADNSMFSGWSGACTGTQSTCEVTMTALKSATATFIPYPLLTVKKAGTGTGTITSDDSGISCGNVDVPDCSEVYTTPESVVLTADPNEHMRITGWVGCGSISVDKTQCTVLMTAAKTVTATFTADPKYTLTTLKGGTGTGTITSDPAGVSCPGDCSEIYWKNTVVTLTAEAADNSMFSGWSGSCTGTQSTCVVTMTALKSVTARFIPYPLLTVKKTGTGTGTITSDDSGISCGNVDVPDCSEVYTTPESVILTADPNEHMNITGWIGCASISVDKTQCTVLMTAPRTVTATFTADPKYTLTTIKGGTGTGTITSDPAGVSCPGDCSEIYWKNTVVTLTAEAADNSMFSGWSGSCTGTQSTCVVTMTALKSMTARFIPYPLLTVKKTGTGSGTVTSNDVTIDCGTDCIEVYKSPDTVTLTADPNEHMNITSWIGCGSVSVDKTRCTVLMTAARTVTATFTADPKYTLTTLKGGTGTGTITSDPAGVSCPGDCSEIYWKNTVVTLTAKAADNSMFSGWSGSCTGAQSTCVVTMTALKSMTAAFIPLSTLNLLTGASWSLNRPVTISTITWINKEGETIESEAISGEIQIIADPAKLTASDIQNIVLTHGGTIFAKLPVIGLYWAKIPGGTEASFISSVQELVSDVFPNMVLENKYLTGQLTMPNNYTYSATNTTPVRVSSGNVIIDDFSVPMCLNCPPGQGEDPIFILKNTATNKLEVDTDGSFKTTIDDSKAAAHGDVVNYYSTNKYTLNTSNASTNLCDRAECSDPARPEYGMYSYESMYLRMAAVIKGSADISKASTINFSQGPAEYAPEEQAGWETYNQTNNWSSLSSVLNVLDSGVKGTDEAMVVMAAGNGSTDITKMLITEQTINPSAFEKVIMVGALDAAGNIAGYSNYSTYDEGMIYVKVDGATNTGVPIDGTSFAAPQVQYLINKIREARPDLTPGQIRQILFDSRLSARQSVPIPNDSAGNSMEVPVISNPLSQSTLDTAKSVAAELFPITFLLSLNKTGTGSGTVSANLSGPSYTAGTTVTLTATPGSKSKFTGWSGACSGTQLTCSLTMTAAKSVTAAFAATSQSCYVDIGGDANICAEISLDGVVIKSTSSSNLDMRKTLSFGSHTLSFTCNCGYCFSYLYMEPYYTNGCTISPSSVNLTPSDIPDGIIISRDFIIK